MLADPIFTVYSGEDPIISNDNWSDAPNAAEIQTVTASIGAFEIPGGSKDAAALISLGPGVYTVQVSGVGGTTGVALVEIYEAP